MAAASEMKNLAEDRNSVGCLDDAICKVLTSRLATQFSVSSKVARKFLLEVVEQWGKLHRLEGRDIMHAHNIVSKHMDGRDVSFIHVCKPVFLENDRLLSFAQ